MSEFSKINHETLPASKSFTNEAILDLEKRFGTRARLLTRFMGIMTENDMPGAKRIYTEKPSVKTQSFISKYIFDPLLGKRPEITGGAPVMAYEIGAKTSSRSDGKYVGLVMLCEDLKLRVLEDDSDQYDENNIEVATDLGDAWFYIGKSYEHHEKSPKSSIYYQHDGPKFRRMPLVEVLNQTIAAQLGPDQVIPVY